MNRKALLVVVIAAVLGVLLFLFLKKPAESQAHFPPVLS